MRRPEDPDESRMREICTSGSRSGRWKRGTVGRVRHRQTKGPATAGPDLNYRATSRLYRWRATLCSVERVSAAQCDRAELTASPGGDLGNAYPAEP